MISAHPHNTAATARDHTPNHRVALVIEDEPQFSHMLAHHLAQVGYQPVQRFRGQEAVEACVLRPDLITLDILLPDLDGWSVLKAIRSAPFMQRVPVLVISVLSAAELGPDCGATAFLHKPTPRAELIDAIERLAPTDRVPLRVLHVDDDPMITEMVEAMLPASRFLVQSVASASQAAEAITNELPDLVLLDLVMPHISGLEFLQTLRGDNRTRHLPVLVLTAKHLSPQEQIDLNQAAQFVLTKSDFTAERMIEKLRHLEKAHSLYHSMDNGDVSDDLKAGDALDVSQFRDDFITEARGCLEALKACCQLDEDTVTAATVERAECAAHMLKGSAGMMGYVDLSELADRAENLLRTAASGETGLNESCLLTLRDLHAHMWQIVDSL